MAVDGEVMELSRMVELVESEFLSAINRQAFLAEVGGTPYAFRVKLCPQAKPGDRAVESWLCSIASPADNVDEAAFRVRYAEPIGGALLTEGRARGLNAFGKITGHIEGNGVVVFTAEGWKE